VLAEEAKENRGELGGEFDALFGDDTDEETEEAEEPNTGGRFGREEGSVVWQPFINNRISKANP
jgi:hypothetical protein